MKHAAILIMMLVVLSTVAYAQDMVMSRGAKPADSIKYGVKKLFESIDLMFTFNQEKKLEKHLFYAEVRQKELETELDKDMAEQVQADYSAKIKTVSAYLNNTAIQNREQLRARVMAMQQKHIVVLERVSEKLDAKGIIAPGVNHALDKAYEKIKQGVYAANITPQLEQIRAERNCVSDTNCACGRHKETGECFIGNSEYVDASQQCPDFCTGIGNMFQIRCESGKCIQERVMLQTQQGGQAKQQGGNK